MNAPVRDTRQPAGSLHPIAAVARRTGLTPHVLRAWERRYGAVEPVRTEGGARLYSEDDVVRLTRLRRAVEAGYGIARAVAMGPAELEAIAAEGEGDPPVSGTRGDTPARDTVEACLVATRELDAPRIHALLSRSLAGLGALAFSQEVVVPLMREVGELWAEGEVCPAHEHAVTFQVRLLLNSLLTALSSGESARAALVTTPRNQLHEVGALLAAIEAASEGWRVIYLGPDLPAHDLVEAVRVSRAELVLLSLAKETAARDLTTELATLRAGIPDSVTVVVGGRGAEPHGAKISSAGALWLPDLPALRELLRSMRPESESRADEASV